MTPVPQRGDKDCGIAALASLAGQAYEDVYLEVARIDKRHRGKQGLHNYEMVAVARRLGLSLHPTRRGGYDLDTDDGILRIRWNNADDEHFGGHFVAVRNGRVACPSKPRGALLDWQAYLDIQDARPCTLLRLT